MPRLGLYLGGFSPWIVDNEKKDTWVGTLREDLVAEWNAHSPKMKLNKAGGGKGGRGKK